MRVLLVSQEMPPETGWGGIGTYVDTISRALVARGADVHVLSVAPEQSASRRTAGGVTVHRHGLPAVPRLARRAPEAWRRAWLPAVVAWLVRRLPVRPDVIEFPEWMAEGLGVRIAGLPLVAHLHSSARQLFPISGQGHRLRGWDGRAAVWLEETSVRGAHAVISTPWNLDEMGPLLRLDPHALHALWYPLERQDRLPMPEPEPARVTFLGRFEPRKGADVLLRAVPSVLAEVPGARFAFVGRSPEGTHGRGSADWLRSEAARLGVAQAVEIRTEFGREAVTRALREATVCAFPSRWESFGYTVAEAQGAGRPVVVSSIPPFRALVQDGRTGFIAADDEPGAWARPLIELLRDPARARSMGEAGAIRVSELTDPAHVADQTLGVYAGARERWRSGMRAGR